MPTLPDGEETQRKKRRPKKNEEPDAEHYITYFPKHPNWEISNDCKITREPCKKKKHGAPDDLPIPEKIGNAITADHMILSDLEASRHGDRVACVVQDRFTGWIAGDAAPTNDSEHTMECLQRFMGPQRKPENVYTDCSK